MARKLIDAWLERRHVSAPDADLAADERMRLIRAFGNFSLACATRDPAHVDAFGDAHGYIAYGQRMGYAFALGDPVAAEAQRAALIDRFVARFGEPCFAQVSRPVAEILAARGYRITSLGVDTALRLESYDFRGREKDGLRYASNWLARRGYRIAERAWSDETRAALETISEQWRGERIVHREMRFLNRPLPTAPSPDMRTFLLSDPAAKPVAFVLLDPLYERGVTIGYVTALKRRIAEAGGYAELGLTRHVIETLKREGLRELRLGLSPLAPAPPSGLRANRLLEGFLRATYRSALINRRIFNLAGQAAYKRRYHGAEEPMFLATRRGSSALQLIAMLRLSKMI